MKPRIGITTRLSPGDRTTGHYVSVNYVQSITDAGGLPWPIPVSNEPDQGAYLDGLDGLLLTGGSDLWPRLYGEDPRPEVTFCDTNRDRWELGLVLEARKRGIPVLGICRGHQLLNVALGGTLWQDLPSQKTGTMGHSSDNLPLDELWHSIRLTPGPSRLKTIFGCEELLVNSFHHQGIKELAIGLVATAFSADGLIEAVEDPAVPFFVGVQFHPESLTKRYPEFLGLFRQFVLDSGAKRPQ